MRPGYGKPTTVSSNRPPIVQTSRSTGQRRIETANVKALRDLQQGISSNAKFGKLVMYSIECVGKMAVDPVTVEEIAESGCLEASLNACVLNNSNEQLQCQVNRAILRSANVNKNCSLLMSQTVNGNFSSFKNSINNHSSSDSLSSTSQVLQMLATVPDPDGENNRIMMKQQGLYTSIADKIASGEVTDPNTLAQLVQVLATGATDPEVSNALLSRNVFAEIQRQTTLNPTNLALAQAYAHLAAQTSLSGANAQTFMQQLDVPTHLSQLITRFPNDKVLAASIKTAIGATSVQSDVAPLMAIIGNTNTKNAQGFSDADILAQKLQASARLATLTLARPNLAYFKGGHGVDHVVFSMQNLVRELQAYNVQGANVLIPTMLLDSITQTALILQNLGTNGAEKQRFAIIQNQGAEVCVAAIDGLCTQYEIATREGDYSTQLQCLQGIATSLEALKSLMSRPENVAFLSQNGLLQQALQSTQGLWSNPAIYSAALDLILAACEHFESLSAEDLATMLSCVCTNIRSGELPQNAELAKKMLRAMCLLAVDEESERTLIEAGAVPFVMQMIEKYIDDPEVVMQGLQTLELALQTEEGIDDFLKHGGEDLLMRLKQLYRDNPTIVAVLDSLLRLCREHRENRFIHGKTMGNNDAAKNRGQLKNQEQTKGQLHADALGVAGKQGYTQQVGMMNMPHMQQQGLTSLDIQEGQQGFNSLNMQDMQQGFNSLNIQDGFQQQQQQQGFNSFQMEDGSMAGGLDVLSQLRAFGLGAGLGATAVTMQPDQNAIQHMSQFRDNANSGDHEETRVYTTVTQLQQQQQDEIHHAQHLISTLNQAQLFITERRAAKLLSLFETLFQQPQSYDRDYLLNAVLDGLAAICEEGFQCEETIQAQGGQIPLDIKPYVNSLGFSTVLNELEQGLIQNCVGQRLCDRVLNCQDELDIAVLSDNLATLLSLIARDSVTLIHVKLGLHPQLNPNVETGDMPYQSSNPTLGLAARQYATQNARLAFDSAYQDLMTQQEMERQQLALMREAEVERMKRLTQNTRSQESALVMARIEQAKKDAAEKAAQLKQEMHERLERARREQEEQIRQMNEEQELRRQQQLENILSAARSATLAKVELERRLAEGSGGVGPTTRTRADILRRLDDATKQFLITGQLVTKHNSISGPSGRHLYVSSNLEYIIFRRAGATEVKKSQMFKLTRFMGIKQGPLCKDLEGAKRKAQKQQRAEAATIAAANAAAAASTPNTSTDDRVSMSQSHLTASSSKAALIEDDDDDVPSAWSNSPYFVLMGYDHDGREREIGFEANTPELCRKIVKAFSHLHEYARTLNEFQDDTLQMHSNPLHNIIQAEKGLNDLVTHENELNERIFQRRKLNGLIEQAANGTGPLASGTGGPTSFEELLGDDDPWKNDP